MSNKGVAWSNPALLLPTSTPRRILHEQMLSFYIMHNYKSPEHVSNDKHDPILTLNHAFQSQRFSSIPALRAQSVPATVTLEIESNRYIREYIFRTFAQEVRREYSRRSLKETQEAVKNDLSDIFISGTAEVENV